MKTREASILELYLNDECDIYRMELSPKGDIQTGVWTKVYSKVKCAASKQQIRHSGQTDTVNIIDYDTKLFLPYDCNIAMGDVVLLYRLGHEIWYEGCGEPTYYSSHIEVMLRRRERI